MSAPTRAPGRNPPVRHGKDTTPVEVYDEDQGAGQPVVLIHGYPLDGHSWEKQTRALRDAGYRTIAFLASLEPFLVQREDNPDGVPPHVFDENLGDRISQEVATANWNLAVTSAPVAAYAVVPTWIEDFRADVEAVREAAKPTLILHGTKDDILPIDATTTPLPETGG